MKIPKCVFKLKWNTPAKPPNPQIAPPCDWLNEACRLTIQRNIDAKFIGYSQTTYIASALRYFEHHGFKAP